MNSERKSNRLLLSLVILLAVACVCLVAWQFIGGPETEPVAAPEVDKKIDTILIAHHEKEDWAPAIEQWDKLLAQEGLDERQRREIRRHRTHAQQAIDIETDGTSQFKRGESDTSGQPKKPAPEKQFTEYYPVGRRLQSVSFFNVNGDGHNEGWALRGDVFFGYEYKVLTETTVTENTGSYAIFEVLFADVTQLRAISKEKVELRVPEIESPVLSLVWQVTDSALKYQSRTYRILRGLGDYVWDRDPRLEITLTTCNELCKQAGVSLIDRDDVEIAAQVETLAGSKLKVTYVRELGVMEIEVLEGNTLPNDQLQRLAYNSSVLADYFIFPESETKKVGDEWDVDAADVAGLFNLEADAEFAGKLELKRGENCDYKGHSCVELEITGGAIDASFEGDVGRQTTKITPLGGSVKYSESMHIVRGARMNWKMDRIQVSDNHLLHGTQVHNMEVESFYEADRLDANE